MQDTSNTSFGNPMYESFGNLPIGVASSDTNGKSNGEHKKQPLASVSSSLPPSPAPSPLSPLPPASHIGRCNSDHTLQL